MRLILFVSLFLIQVLPALAKSPGPDLVTYQKVVRPFLSQHCFKCHGAKKQKADLDLEAMGGDVVSGEHADMWREALDLMNSGEMPPRKEPRPKTDQLLATVKWLTGELDKAVAAAKMKGGGIRIRRLTNQEYRNTLLDLVGHPYDPTPRFLDDNQVHGFENVASASVLSPLHMQQYLASAEKVVGKIISTARQKAAPKKHHWRIKPILNKPTDALVPFHPKWHDGLREKDFTKVKPGKIPLPKKSQHADPGPLGLNGPVRPNAEIPHGWQRYRMVDLSGKKPVAWDGFGDIRMWGGRPKGAFHSKLGFKWFLHDEGVYRVTAHFTGYAPENHKGKVPTLAAYLLPENRLIGEYECPPGKPRTISFNVYRDNVEQIFRHTGSRFWGVEFKFRAGPVHASAIKAKTTKATNAAKTSKPSVQKGKGKGKTKEKAKDKARPILNEPSPHLGVHLRAIDIQGPINPSWPPVWQRSVLPERRAKQSDLAYAREVIIRFAARAWRRPLKPEERSQLMSLYQQQRAKSQDIYEALRLPLTSVLSSPHFLCLIVRRDDEAGPQQLSPHELATRLSYFLWRSMPDRELRKCADDGSLLKDEVLKQQLRRMLKHPRIKTFTQTFPTRWFGLDNVQKMNVDERLYGSFTNSLQDDMVRETTEVFHRIFAEDRSALELLDSDWTMLNGNLARHYNIKGVAGEHFQLATLKPRNRRGGVLAHASVLTLTSNGVRTLPITRGTFILENILASPPPAPPPNVSQLENTKPPRPNATIRELLEIHREDPTCASCHEKIDPIGFALEAYDAVGRWRTHERKLINGKVTRTHPVDVKAQLPGGKPFSGLPGLKRILKSEAPKFRRCLAEKLLVYALDREVSFRDETLIQELANVLEESGDSIQALVEAICLSETFRTK